jgi:hypothetical protein
LDQKELPNKNNQSEKQLNDLFDSVEPDPEFAKHLEERLFQAIREQQANRISSPYQGAWLRSNLGVIGKWGITLVGLGILIIVLVYSINYLIPPAHLPAVDQPGQVPLVATAIPTNQPTANATSSAAADTPILTPAVQSLVTVIEGNDVTSVNLRSCPSVTCAVVGEMLFGQQVQAVGMVSDGSWIQVEYGDAPEGKAWVYGKLVQLNGEPPPVVLILPTPTPFLPAISSQACKPSGKIKPLLGYLPMYPTQIIDGGFVQSGDFIFEILLGCDSLFGPNAEVSNHYSDIPGLGAHLVLSYRGSAEEGEILEAWGVREAGTQSVAGGEGSSMSGMIASSISTQLTGLRFPSELLPTLSHPGEYPLEFVYQARNPQGAWTGAVLGFTLVNQPDGFYLTDIEIQPLSSQQVSAQKQQSYTGPENIGAISNVPAGDALYIARTVDVQRDQNGIEQTLFTWPEPIPDLLAGFSADGSALAARMNNGDIAVVGLPQGELLRTLRLGVDYREWPTSLTLSPDGSRLALAMGENTIQIWEVDTGELLTTLTQPGEGVTYQILSFSPDGETLLGGFLNTITRWEIASREAVTFEPGCRGDAIFDLVYSPDGKNLAIACGPAGEPIGFLIVWNVLNNRPIFQKEEIPQMQRVAFSPDGAWLASGGPGGTIMLWDVTGKEEPISFQNQTTPVDDLVFSPDGSQLVVATEGKLVYLPITDHLPL